MIPPSNNPAEKMPSGIAENLRPWIVMDDEEPACWKLRDGRIALALFTDKGKADTYGQGTLMSGGYCRQPEPAMLIQILIECVKSDISIAVLNPNGESAIRLFELRKILKKVREDLHDGRSLDRAFG